jgi:hypothetical protein
MLKVLIAGIVFGLAAAPAAGAPPFAAGPATEELSRLSGVDALAMPVVEPAKQAAIPLPVHPPLISRSYWDGAQPPAAPALKWLETRVPEFPAGSIRELDLPAITAILEEAVRRRYANIDMFTDAGLRGDEAFFLSADTLAAIFRDFDLNSTLLASGTTLAGQPFIMQGIVMGRGQFNVLYDRDQFDFYNAEDDYAYRVDKRVTHGIEGPGKLSVQGLWAYASKIRVRIVGSEKISPTMLRVDTRAGSFEHPIRAVRRR